MSNARAAAAAKRRSGQTPFSLAPVQSFFAAGLSRMAEDNRRALGLRPASAAAATEPSRQSSPGGARWQDAMFGGRAATVQPSQSGNRWQDTMSAAAQRRFSPPLAAAGPRRPSRAPGFRLGAMWRSSTPAAKPRTGRWTRPLRTPVCPPGTGKRRRMQPFSRPQKSAARAPWRPGRPRAAAAISLQTTCQEPWIRARRGIGSRPTCRPG
jgi:hypothetical protein